MNRLKLFKAIEISPLTLSIHLLGSGLFLELATRGQWFSLSNPSDGRAHFFTAQASALIQGRFDVNELFLAGWQGECFNYADKCLGYFGLTPSIFRIPFLPFAGRDLVGLNPIWFVLIAWTIYLFASFRVIDEVVLLLNMRLSEIQETALRVSVYAGPVLFLAPNPYVYYEAIFWSVSLGMVSIYFLLRYMRLSNAKYFLIASLFVFLTLHARIVEGAGVAAAMMGLIIYQHVKKQLDRSTFLKFLSLTLFALATLPVLNMIKFGEIQPSIQLHHGGVMADPYRLRFYEAVGVFRFTRIPKLLAAYLTPNFQNWLDGFAFTPNAYYLQIPFFKVPLYSVEQSEYFSPFSSTFPFTFILSLFGLYYLITKLRTHSIFWVIIGSLTSVFIISANIGATQRYLNDFWLPFFLLSIIGISMVRTSKVKTYSFILMFLLVVQVFQSLNTTLNYWNFWSDIPKDYYMSNLVNLFERLS